QRPRGLPLLSSNLPPMSGKTRSSPLAGPRIPNQFQYESRIFESPLRQFLSPQNQNGSVARHHARSIIQPCFAFAGLLLCFLKIFRDGISQSSKPHVLLLFTIRRCLQSGFHTETSELITPVNQSGPAGDGGVAG